MIFYPENSKPRKKREKFKGSNLIRISWYLWKWKLDSNRPLGKGNLDDLSTRRKNPLLFESYTFLMKHSTLTIILFVWLSWHRCNAVSPENYDFPAIFNIPVFSRRSKFSPVLCLPFTFPNFAPEFLIPRQKQQCSSQKLIFKPVFSFFLF